MAKQRKHGKKSKRDRRDAGGTLPKRIAGVKVPKSLRKGSALRELADNPLVRDIVAAALTSAAAAIASRKGGEKAGIRREPGAGAVVAAFAAAAGDVVRQLREARREPPAGTAPASEAQADQPRPADRNTTH